MRKVISLIFLLLLCFSAHCQDRCLTDTQTKQKHKTVKIYFGYNSHAIDLGLQQNRESLLSLSNIVERLDRDTLSVISRVEINSYTSPEGGRTYNRRLSEKRSNSIYNYLTKIISVPDSLIDKNYSGTDWDELRRVVGESDMQYRDEVLSILNNVPEETWRKVDPNDRWLSLVDSRNKHLMELRYGKPYRYMFANIFPELRNGSVVTIYVKRKVSNVVVPESEIVAVEEVDPQIAPEPKQIVRSDSETTVKPLFALKTNLLFDAATLTNVEVEVPIGKRWSVAGEWIFPWWISDNGNNNSKRNRTQLLNCNIEGKYWFGDRSDRPVMTGWFAGLYAGGGIYDFERNAKGYQGEFFIAAGVGGGYAHTINKSGTLRMEYSVGIGYLKTDYRYYESQYDIDNRWHPIRQQNGIYTWIGPTQAKISLAWLLNHKSKRGGKR